MIKTQLGLKKAVSHIKRIKNSLKKTKNRLEEQLLPHKERISKIRSKLAPEIEKLQDEEYKLKMNIFEYITENEYEKVDGLSVRKLIKYNITNRNALITWTIQSDNTHLLNIDEKALVRLAKNISIPGIEEYTEAAIVIST